MGAREAKQNDAKQSEDINAVELEVANLNGKLHPLDFLLEE